MLSNKELMLLKFVKTKPSYAYEIEKMIEDREIRTWVKIGGTTIYQALDRLCNKGLLAYKIEKEGNMPQRKRYYITENGNKAFENATEKILKHSERYYFDLSVGLSCRNLMDSEIFKQTIQERLINLNDFVNHFNEKFAKTKELYPTKRLMVKEYLLSHYQLEQRFLEKILKEMDNKGE
ncbi:transcriptional regulator PadR-like family protein [Desulfosporosinus acididurans]|uniref:Transcriptional regulator PadR-like family protein n=1 Tax=Desulfosporosinus acididurans TaxID=476652 RepID=A0A0J1FUG1_9FIRM|nr:PadR family transcriptional regulator [Desulfosporosinus acididurans]KLU66947.1 transcriptional regulator PadR-like family protein [Desulfosporosinus acididurans]